MRLIQSMFAALLLGFTSMANAGGIITDQADIVDIMTSINVGEIQAAQLALKKTQNPQVKEFAQQMHDDHNALNKQFMNLDIKLDIPADRSMRSLMIKQMNDFTVDQLQDKTGKDFDEAYMDSQELMHKMALETIEHSLIPSAKDAKLKAALQQAREKVAGHLKRAHTLEEQLDD